MRKMKDMRGAHVSAVRNAIAKKVRLQLISNRHKNSREILDWKQSKEVKDSYNKLFTEEIAIEEITTFASFEEAPDISSKNKSADDNEDEEGQDEDEFDFDFKSYDGMFD
jgi:hypothetical protein